MGFFSNLFKKDPIVNTHESIPMISIRTDISMGNVVPLVQSAPTKDMRVAICPNCQHDLDKIPDRKKKCPHCDKYIYSYATEVSPGNWERHLRTEEEGKRHNDIIHEEKEAERQYVNSGNYLKDSLDRLKGNGVNTVHIIGGGCEKCMGEKIMSISSAYKTSPSCPNCGYGYTVTGYIE